MTINLLTFDGIALDSTEILNFNYNRKFNIILQDTVSSKTLTQPGNLSPIIFRVDAKIMTNAPTKYFQWRNKLQAKTLASLNFLNADYGAFYLSEVDITCNLLNDIGEVMDFDMSLTFIQNQNF
ncbi:MAG: hypothetical protein HC907_17775 [Richelia sp. SM1_7_0]|nr:hypothetical protein [Richelia sp. SM1_7_0]